MDEKPDLYFTMIVNASVRISKSVTAERGTSAEWHFDFHYLNPGDNIVIQFYDDDYVMDDYIGDARFTVEQTSRSGNVGTKSDIQVRKNKKFGNYLDGIKQLKADGRKSHLSKNTKMSLVCK